MPSEKLLAAIGIGLALAGAVLAFVDRDWSEVIWAGTSALWALNARVRM